MVELPGTSGAVVIDGDIGDAAWGGAVKIALAYENSPGDNLPARVDTVAWLLEDGASLYVAFVASDPDPEAIRAYLRDRDTAFADDYVGIVLDTYNDGRRAFEFFANPLGVQMDLTNDDGGSGGQGGKEDESWDAIWESAGQVTAAGYVVEMRIPLRQLRFPATGEEQVWGMDLIRNYPRDKRYLFSSNIRERGANCYLCQLGKIRGLENAVPGRDLEFVPTLTVSNSKFTDEPGIDPLVSGGTESDAGLSVRWGVSPDVTANLAINPDFSQVEADAAQLDVNNQFALFFPERRPFFLEGYDYFTTPFQAVFTRTIANPKVGAKLTGKRGDNTFGFYTARDEQTNLLFPGAFESDTEILRQPNTALVGRYSRGFAGTSSLGALTTMRKGDGYKSYTAGLDGRWQPSRSHTFTFQHLESETRYPAGVAENFNQPLGDFDGRATIIRYDFKSRHWFGELERFRFSDGFRADSGFQTRVGIEQATAEGGYIWYGADDDWWTRVRVQSKYEITHLVDGTLAGKELSARIAVSGPLQSTTQIVVETESALENGVLFSMDSMRFHTEFTPIGGLTLSLFANIGEQIDYANTRLGRVRTLRPIAVWNASRNLLLSVSSAFSSLDTKSGESVFDASVIDARATWQFSLRSFLRLIVQRSDTRRNLDVYIDDGVDARSRDVGRQLLYSYKINPQTVFFLGYSDQYVDDDGLDRLTASDRSIFMKIGYAWSL